MRKPSHQNLEFSKRFSYLVVNKSIESPQDEEDDEGWSLKWNMPVYDR